MKTLVAISLCLMMLLPTHFAFAGEDVSGQQNPVPNNSVTEGLFKNRNKFALLFFVQPGCIYCAKQLSVLQEFQKMTGWYIKTIDITENPNAKADFNVSGTPVLVLIKKNMPRNKWWALSIGLSPLDTLSSDAYTAIRILNGQMPQGHLYVRSQASATTPITQ